MVIPLKLDSKAAIEELKRLAAHGSQAGKDTGDGLEDAGKKAKGLGSAVSEIISHQGYQMLRDAAQALGKGYQETAEYVKAISVEYTNLRGILQQVAALRGMENTGSFTTDQAKQAAQAGLKPEEWVKFQETFQSYAGAYLEGDSRKISDSEAVKYQQQLALFAKARGINPAEIGQIGGGVLQFSDEKLTSDQAMAQVGRQFKTLERAPTPVSQLLPQMTRIMAQGASGDEASQLLTLASEFAPGEEGTFVENTLKGLRQNLIKGKGSELGITKDMSPLQRVQAAVKTLQGRESKGEDLDKVIDDLFGTDRESRGIKGFMNRGGDAADPKSGFARVAGYGTDTPDDFTQTAIAKYKAGDQGRFAQGEADRARARIESGERTKELAQLKLDAETKLTEEGRFEHMTGAMDAVRGLLPGLPGIKEQLINERAYAMAREKSGAATGESRIGAVGAFAGFGEEQSTIDEMILAELKIANEQRGKAAEKPLSAPPPNPTERP